jgi:type I restriction enzyme S subunit
MTTPRPYTACRPSGVPCLGDVPAHWDVRRLRTVADMRVSNVDKHVSEGELPVRLCNYVDVYKNDHITHEIAFMRATASTDEVERFRLKRGDVLITKDSETWDDIGVPALVTESADDLVCGYHLALLRPSKEILGAYLARALQTGGVARQFHVRANGVTRYGLTQAGIQSVQVPLPPPDEQAAIVGYLDADDQRIRAYVSAKERLIALLEEERQAVIQRAVTRGLDPNVKLKSSRVEWLGDMPEHWEVGRLKAVSEIRYGLGQPPRESATGLPLIRATNVSRGHIAEKDLLRVDPADVPVGRDAFLREKEIIVVRSGAYTADSAIIPREYTGSVTGYDMVVNVTGAIPEFIAAALLSKYLRDDQLIVASNRAAQPHLNAEELGAAFILLPPLPEQGSIVQHLERVNTDIDTGVSLARRQIELMEEYRTRLIAEVVTGKLDVREAKP